MIKRKQIKIRIPIRRVIVEAAAATRAEAAVEAAAVTQAEAAEAAATQAAAEAAAIPAAIRHPVIIKMSGDL